jgi:hypothetical protein
VGLNCKISADLEKKLTGRVIGVKVVGSFKSGGMSAVKEVDEALKGRGLGLEIFVRSTGIFIPNSHRIKEVSWILLWSTFSE